MVLRDKPNHSLGLPGSSTHRPIVCASTKPAPS
uniref:Uncharacterized protein n=1 Tax=Anguilla anguilla TaxID=7936 RepID=A0A0E9Q5N8_ANGAN